VDDLRFEWDSRKAADNRRKHGVSFDEAATAFYDEHALFMGDPDHSIEEDRFLLLGMSAAMRLLVVCHCHRQPATVIRIISARKASRTEHQTYFARWKS
jgi:uncharacterized DUF497 family protein